MLPVLVSLGFADDSCFPKLVLIEDSEVLDNVSSLNITSYTINTEYSQDCSTHQSLNKTEILVATIEQGNLKTSVETLKTGNLPNKQTNQWNIRINASYFDKQGKPTLLLKEKAQNLGNSKTNRGGVFYCTTGVCDITPSSKYKEDSSHDIAIQSTPRLINGGQYTKGVHKPNVKDQRIGLAITKDKQLLIFQSDRANFNELRRFLLTELNVVDAVALDGGSSTSFHSLSSDEAGNIHQIDLSHFFLVPVPYYLNFSNSN